MSDRTERPTASSVEERRASILERLEAVGRVEVAALSGTLGVTEETIRRDLRALEDDGLLERAHGGAVRSSGAFAGGPSPAELVAAAAGRLVPADAQILLGGGAACEALAGSLAGRSDVTIFTSSVAVALAAATAETRNTVHVLGGTVDAAGSLTGAWVRGRLDDLRVDVAFITASGLREDGRLLHRSPDEASLVVAIIRAARSTVLLEDPLAAGSRGSTTSVGLAALTAAVLGDDVSATTTAMLDDAGVRIHRTAELRLVDAAGQVGAASEPRLSGGRA